MAVPARGGSAGLWCECFELLERGEQLLGPGPAVLEVQFRAAAGEREPSGDVEEAVAQAFGFGFGEFAVKHECLGPDEQVVREHHDL